MKNSKTAFIRVKIVSKSLKLQNREGVDFLFRAGSENKEMNDDVQVFNFSSHLVQEKNKKRNSVFQPALSPGVTYLAQFLVAW